MISIGREKQMLLELFDYIVANKAAASRLLSEIRVTCSSRSATFVGNIVY